MPDDAHRMYVDFRNGHTIIFQCDRCTHRSAVDTATGAMTDNIDQGDTSVVHIGATDDITLVALKAGPHE